MSSSDSPRRFTLTGTRCTWHAHGDYSWTPPEIEPSPAENEVVEVVEASALEAADVRVRRLEDALRRAQDGIRDVLECDDAEPQWLATVYARITVALAPDRPSRRAAPDETAGEREAEGEGGDAA